jgi:hypothetical protein
MCPSLSVASSAGPGMRVIANRLWCDGVRPCFAGIVCTRSCLQRSCDRPSRDPVARSLRPCDGERDHTAPNLVVQPVVVTIVLVEAEHRLRGFWPEVPDIVACARSNPTRCSTS